MTILASKRANSIGSRDRVHRFLAVRKAITVPILAPGNKQCGRQGKKDIRPSGDYRPGYCGQEDAPESGGLPQPFIDRLRGCDLGNEPGHGKGDHKKGQDFN